MLVALVWRRGAKGRAPKTEECAVMQFIRRAPKTEECAVMQFIRRTDAAIRYTVPFGVILDGKRYLVVWQDNPTEHLPEGAGL